MKYIWGRIASLSHEWCAILCENNSNCYLFSHVNASPWHVLFTYLFFYFISLLTCVHVFIALLYSTEIDANGITNYFYEKSSFEIEQYFNLICFNSLLLKILCKLRHFWMPLQKCYFNYIIIIIIIIIYYYYYYHCC